MLNIAKLFGKSPFSPIQLHLEKVSSCMKELKTIVSDLTDHNQPNIELLVIHLLKLHHEAEMIKKDIQMHLPKGLFLALNKRELLKFLEIQDHLCHTCLEIGHTLSLHKLTSMNHVIDYFKNFFLKNNETFHQGFLIMKEMEKLMESSFGGLEAQKVQAMINQLEKMRKDSEEMKHKLIQKIYDLGKNLSAPEFFQWMQLIEKVHLISKGSENLSLHIGQLLDIN
jgi:predicted phosphate transport protein (TIGR00153 family)